MRFKKILWIASSLIFSNTVFAAPIVLQEQAGLFRLSFDEMNMPNHISDMGLLGINYFADINPLLYGGLSGYGSVSGTQGGLFVLGFTGGLHKELMPHWWADANFFVGGGGGHSSLVGGGLMIRPSAGLAYQINDTRIGVHYSYIDFTSGVIRSSQVGLDVDIPCRFYFIPNRYQQTFTSTLHDVLLPNGKNLFFQHNDFSLLAQAYVQKKGTLDTRHQVQDSTMKLVGAELDHYLNQKLFWYLKSAGAFSGVPNGYMDVLGGVGYRLPLRHFLNFMPQFALGAGGGGTIDTGGGFLVNPQLAMEWPLSKNFAARIAGGYLWAPMGNLSAFTATGMITYHLDVATAGNASLNAEKQNNYDPQWWRIFLANQTYLHPQRTTDITSSINLIVLQIDQIFNPYFFFSYQAASAYQGDHAGGLASGMIGPGLQTPTWFNRRLQFYTNVLVGAAGGGSLDVNGGAVYEPVVGLHFALTPAIGLQASVSQLKAFNGSLNTTVVNAGFSIKFGTLNG